MQISGLQEDEVKSLEKVIDRLKTINPNITYKLLTPEPKETDVEKELRLLNEKVDGLLRVFKHTFGGHCLIKGHWSKIVIKEAWKG
jgi:hypothetical protein